MKTKIIKFIGFSGSGKTTLIEKIVRKLSSGGIKVATVKHDVHGLEIDREGKDSYKYSEAGAKISVVSSPEMTVYKVHEKLSLDEILSKVEGVDIILVEGYSNEECYPCICVARKETGKGFKNDFKGYEAIASDYSEADLRELGFNGKVYNIDNINGIIDYIKGL
jgi:molybdopterin-guanine dinucleotide biosynthesis protein B